MTETAWHETTNGDTLMLGQRQALTAFFLKQRIPSATGWASFAESGNLFSYGTERAGRLAPPCRLRVID